MAIVDSNIKLKGTVDKDYSVYERRDMPGKYIYRAKGGASKAKIKHGENFARTRSLNKEWAGCSQSGKGIRTSIHPVTLLADYNISGPLNAIAKQVQKLDTENAEGKRNVLFSRYREILEGFSLNQQRPLDTIIKSPVNGKMDRSTGSAWVELPVLMPGVNFNNHHKYSFIRFTAVLGIISDMVFRDDLEVYRPENTDVHGKWVSSSTDWQLALKSLDKQVLELTLDPDWPLTGSEVLLLALGIEFGASVTNNLVEPIKYSGSAKVLVTA